MDQINKLANWIMANHPEAITDGGAGDVAIRLIKQLIKERDDALNEHEDALAWSHLWRRSARQFRSMSQGAKLAWEEARRWAIHFREKYEQGAPMTIAGMNTRIAELEERNDTLEKILESHKRALRVSNNHWWGLLADLDEARDLAIHFKKKSDRRKVIIQKIGTLSLKNSRLRNEMIAELEDKVAHLEMELEFFMGLSGTRRADISSEVVDNLHKEFVKRHKEKAASSIDLPYAYPTHDNA